MKNTFIIEEQPIEGEPTFFKISDSKGWLIKLGINNLIEKPRGLKKSHVKLQGVESTRRKKIYYHIPNSVFENYEYNVEISDVRQTYEESERVISIKGKGFNIYCTTSEENFKEISKRFPVVLEIIRLEYEVKN